MESFDMFTSVTAIIKQFAAVGTFDGCVFFFNSDMYVFDVSSHVPRCREYTTAE